ncbi:MAG TPA: zf-HC2 domain-containing protein [Gaiellaceae bacterium]|nr:zf-HC2 domain-containing protein [Gaiellaceae bacterium]
MLTPVPPTDCMLARESASVRLDGELSELESARLDAHLRVCADCRAYAAEVGAIAEQLRKAALERPGQQIALPRRRALSGARMQVAAAAAAVVVAAAAAISSFTLGHTLTTARTVPALRGVGESDLLSLRADSTAQHLLLLLPQPAHEPPRPGELEAV